MMTNMLIIGMIIIVIITPAQSKHLQLKQMQNKGLELIAETQLIIINVIMFIIVRII